MSENIKKPFYLVWGIVVLMLILVIAFIVKIGEEAQADNKIESSTVEKRGTELPKLPEVTLPKVTLPEVTLPSITLP